MKYILPFIVCILIVSCLDEGDCLVSATNLMHIQFKKKKNSAADTLIRFAYKSVDIGGTNISFTYSATSEILLPLDIDPSKTSTTFIFHRINTDSTIQETDTLQVGYTTQIKVISKDCGAYAYYQNLKILGETSIDSIYIKKFRPYLLKDPSSSLITAYALNYQILY